MKIIISLLLSAFLFSCAFDEKEVRDEQDKQRSREMNDKVKPYYDLQGGYAGKFYSGNREFDLFARFDVEFDKDGNPNTKVEIKRTDLAVDNAVLRGYLVGGKLTLTSPTSTTTEAFLSMVGDYRGGQTSGSLSDSTGTVGTFSLSRTTDLPENLSSINFCDPLAKDLRNAVYEISGDYEAIVIPESGDISPYAVLLKISPTKEGKLQAYFKIVNGDRPQLVYAVYVPWMTEGGRTGKIEVLSKPNDKLSVTLKLMRSTTNSLVGEATIGTTHSSNMTFSRTSRSVPDICAP